jgi:hypothetical protein
MRRGKTLIFTVWFQISQVLMGLLYLSERQDEAKPVDTVPDYL